MLVQLSCFFTLCKNKESNVMVLLLYTGCVKICKLCCKKNQLFPQSLTNKYKEELLFNNLK